MHAGWPLANGTATELHDAVEEGPVIIGIGEDRPAERTHEAHLIGRTHIGAWSTKWCEVDDHRVTGPHDTFHRATDCETAFRKRQSRAAGLLLIGREDASEPVLHAKHALAHADLAGIGKKDFGPCKVDADGHATSAPIVAISMPARLSRLCAVSDECTQRYATPI